MDGPTLDQRFVETFRLAARQAGAVALRLRGKVKAESKPANGPEAEALTAVDLATQDLILHLIHDRLPGVAMDAEEDTETLALFAGNDPASALVVVDPIDGTLNYIRGSDDFAVMGALLREGTYTAAVIHFPVHRITYWGIRGGGVFAARDGSDPRRCDASGATNRIFYAPRVPATWRSALAPHTAQVELCRCSAVDSSAPVSGRARAAVAEDRADRRRAIGLFLSLEAGAAVRMGGHVWRGEDPEALSPELRPTLVADTVAFADVLLQAVQRAATPVPP
jgi:fructose-1,6-bisphosphatase/inositol monophosphatase family enzyme